MTIPAYAKKTVQLIAPSTSAAATASTSSRMDMDDASYATIVVNISSEADVASTGVVLSLASGDTTTLASAVTMIADVTKTVVAAGAHTYHVDNRGGKRYVFLTVTPDTVATTGAVAYSACAYKSRLKQGPSSTTGMSETTNDTATVV